MIVIVVIGSAHGFNATKEVSNRPSSETSVRWSDMPRMVKRLCSAQFCYLSIFSSAENCHVQKVRSSVLSSSHNIKRPANALLQ